MILVASNQENSWVGFQLLKPISKLSLLRYRNIFLERATFLRPIARPPPLAWLISTLYKDCFKELQGTRHDEPYYFRIYQEPFNSNTWIWNYWCHHKGSVLNGKTVTGGKSLTLDYPKNGEIGETMNASEILNPEIEGWSFLSYGWKKLVTGTAIPPLISELYLFATRGKNSIESSFIANLSTFSLKESG